MAKPIRPGFSGEGKKVTGYSHTVSKCKGSTSQVKLSKLAQDANASSRLVSEMLELKGEIQEESKVSNNKHKDNFTILPWPRIAIKYFKNKEFQSLHPQAKEGFLYHDACHSENTASVMYQLASVYDPKNAEFLSQVALIHDIDPFREVGISPRVPATLEWMENNKAEIINRFKWSERQFNVAKAIIMRTEFPFDENTRSTSYNDFYKQKSPVERYKEMLKNLNKTEKEFVMQRGALLSEYADKASWYMKPFPVARLAVRGLVNEAQAEKKNVDLITLKTSDFLKKIGTSESFAFDYQIARLAIPGFHLPLINEVMEKLSWDKKENFIDNINKFNDSRLVH